jgi:glycosyltransferase involved in cell wall biosynthesis
LPSPPYDVLISMPWAGPSLTGSAPAGGAETQMIGVARGLAAGGLRVGLVVVGRRSELPARVDGVEVLAQRPPPRVRGLAGLVHDAATLLGMARPRARVLVTRNASRSVAVVWLAARLRRAAFVYSSANVVDFDLGQLEPSYNVRLFEAAVRGASELVVQTEEQAALARSRFGRDPVVIRSIAARAERRHATPDSFLWVGRMAPYKRLDVLVELAAAVPEARFHVIGVPGREAQPEMEALLERARHMPNVEVLDPRPRAQLAVLIERAVAIVNTAEYEGMPNVFLEGWARGVPALAYSHDPDGVVAKHGLGAFADGSFDRLVELARAQWASRGQQHEVAARCIEYVRGHHDSEVVVAAWRSVVDSAAPRT